jgi:MerR family transcriptional regulator, light-induced transcriptional regulator
VTGTPGPGHEGRLTLEAVAEQLGLHYMTVYRHVRLGRLPAERLKGRWWVRPEDLGRVRPATGASRRGRTGRRWADRSRRLQDRLLVGDSLGSWAVIEEGLSAGIAPTDVYLKLLAPALRRIGDLWASGQIGVDAEHRATATAVRIAGRVGPLFARPGPLLRGVVVLGGAPGDPHQLPVTMVADVMRGARLQVVDLGANVPKPSFLDAGRATSDLRVFAVSLSVSADAPATASLVRALHRAHPGVPVVAGGPALDTRAGATDLGADAWAPDAVAAARLLSSKA